MMLAFYCLGGNIPQTVDVNTKTVSGNRKK